MAWVGLSILGLVVGCVGTLIGAGGGFMLMPVLLLLYPGEEPRTLASISLGVVFLNALSGSLGYARQRQIDYRSGIAFSLAGVPGAILGAVLVGYVSRTVFDVLLGGVLVLVAGFLLMAGRIKPAQGSVLDGGAVSGPPRGGARPGRRPWRGIGISFLVGVVSSLLGIGGGIIHVPAMVYALGFPVHTATATSHFVLAATSAAGTAVHVATGAFPEGVRRTLVLGLGAAIGAQVGALLSSRAKSAWIIRGLGVALAIVGARLVYTAAMGRAG